MLHLQCIDFDSGSRSLGYDGQMIRTAYLYADTVIVSGDACFTIDFEHQYRPDVSPARKKMVVEHFAKHLTPPADKQAAVVFRGQKEMQAIKHKNHETIVKLKIGEKIIDGIYHDCVCYMRKSMQVTGLPELINLYGEGLDLKAGSMSRPEASVPLYFKGSDLLKEKWTGTDEVYAFTNSFWDYLKENNLSLSAANEMNEPADVITFKLPFIGLLNSFIAADLKLLKRDMLPDPQNLRQAIAAWSMELKSADFSFSRLSSYLAYFSTEIAPHLPGMEQGIKANEMHQRMADYYRGMAGSEVYLAIAKAKTVWDYMEWDKLVPKESIHAFMEDLPACCDENKAVLLFLCKSFNLHKTEMEVSDKKSLQL